YPAWRGGGEEMRKRFPLYSEAAAKGGLRARARRLRPEIPEPVRHHVRLVRGIRPGGGRPALFAARAEGEALGGERRLGLLGDRLERRRLVDREIRQHLAVDHDARLGEAVDKSAVGQAERAHRGVQPLDPECTEGALLALAVAER